MAYTEGDRLLLPSMAADSSRFALISSRVDHSGKKSAKSSTIRYPTVGCSSLGQTSPPPSSVGGGPWLGIVGGHRSESYPSDSTDQEKVKPYGCHHCSYRSRQRVHLEDHLRTHTGEKPFRCTLCSAGFSQRSNLKRHVRTHGAERTPLLLPSSDAERMVLQRTYLT